VPTPELRNVSMFVELRLRSKKNWIIFL
jgi:hypothetical protein